jgi:hypothetical protein
MTIGAQQPKLLIARDASDLAFQIGQAIEKGVIQRAIEHAVARKGELVSVKDVEAAAAEVKVLAAWRASRVIADDKAAEGEPGRGSDAA